NGGTAENFPAAPGRLVGGPHTGPGPRRAEVRMEAPAAPGRLDEEHRLAEMPLHEDADGELVGCLPQFPARTAPGWRRSAGPAHAA
ncbi:MAG: hypothetical protein J0L84_12495, partial [Verrucomicrobia bacterium]|nr:hypothetical protein [Verrucomicrobiota bacterium]